MVQTTLEHPTVVNPVYRLRTPDERQRSDVLVKALRIALKNPSSDAQEALSPVAREWRKLDEKNPKYLEEYRLAIGLSRQ